MAKEIKTSKKISIQKAGFDEYWLQDRIYENPSIMGLGNLVPISKEKKQSSGGKLDILLKDPQYNSMYEVEAMLGETDPSHIIRSIEYWDIEKRRYPNRQHFSVLVAESFDRRYFNVIQIFSLNIPMIAIQADLLEVQDIQDKYILNFTKLLDIYEEPEEEEASEPASESSWKENANWTLEAAKELLKILSEVDTDLTLGFTQSYIRLTKNSKGIYYLFKKSEPKSSYCFKEKDDEMVESIKSELDKQNISYTYNKSNDFSFTVDKLLFSANADVFKEIHKLKLAKEGTIQSEESQT